MSDDIDKVERSYITLAEQFEGSVIINDAVHYAKIVGVEIVNFNGEDTNEDQLVVIVGDVDGSISAHRVETAFNHECYAKLELERRLGWRAKCAAMAIERKRQAAA
jgi:hypothetical protein